MANASGNSRRKVRRKRESRSVRLKQRRGLPAKSYMYVMTLDLYLREALSLLEGLEMFDMYVASCVEWKHKYGTREDHARSFLSFLACHGPERIDFLLPSGFMPRSRIVAFLTMFDKSIRKYLAIIATPMDKWTAEEKRYVVTAEYRWRGYKDVLIRSIGPLLNEIKSLNEIMARNYTSFILKGLMKKRRSIKDPRSLTSSAYDVLLLMIDSYDYSKSKVPFSKYLTYFIKKIKARDIVEEDGKLKEFVVSLDEEEVEETSVSHDDAHAKNAPIDHSRIYNNLREQRMDRERRLILDKLSTYVPKTFYNLLVVTSGVIDPLTLEEEIAFIQSGHSSEDRR